MMSCIFSLPAWFQETQPKLKHLPNMFPLISCSSLPARLATWKSDIRQSLYISKMGRWQRNLRRKKTFFLNAVFGLIYTINRVWSYVKKVIKKGGVECWNIKTSVTLRVCYTTMWCSRSSSSRGCYVSKEACDITVSLVYDEETELVCGNWSRLN